jgi:hypothetical protein
MAKTWTAYKDPNEVLDYSVDWSGLLAGDTIASSTWTVPTGVTGGAMSYTDTETLIWLSGGSDGERYDLLNRITTAAGRTRDQTCVLKIKTK